MGITAEQERQLISLRRSKIADLISKGCGNNHAEIARALNVSEPTVCKDIKWIFKQSEQQLHELIDKQLPQEYSTCLLGLNNILKESWSLYQDTKDPRAKISALSLAKECHDSRLQLMTRPNVIQDIIKFVNRNKNSPDSNWYPNDVNNDDKQPVDEELKEEQEIENVDRE